MAHENLIGDFPTFPKQQRSMQKRQALLESGRILFGEKGYEHTTAKEIAAHAKVATGTFYRYFSDKRQLLMSLIEDHIDDMMPIDLEWKSGDPEKLLAGRLEMHYHKINEKNLRRLMPEILFRDAELAEVVQEAKTRMLEKVTEHLHLLHRKGLMWQDIEIETLGWSLQSLMEKLQSRNDQGLPVDYQAFSKIFCRMLFPPEVIQKMRNGTLNEWKGP